MGRLNIPFSATCLLLLFTSTTISLPLSTDSQRITDEKGQCMKLVCMNWVSQLEAMVAEGLSKQPVDAIAKRITAPGFNYVWRTWPLYLITNNTFASLTIRKSFKSLSLLESISEIQSNNPPSFIFHSSKLSR